MATPAQASKKRKKSGATSGIEGQSESTEQLCSKLLSADTAVPASDEDVRCSGGNVGCPELRIYPHPETPQYHRLMQIIEISKSEFCTMEDLPTKPHEMTYGSMGQEPFCPVLRLRQNHSYSSRKVDFAVLCLNE